jgi:hypothetical protein
MNRSDLPDIKQGLKDRILDLCRQLLPDGRPMGRLFVAHNPVTRDDAQSPEFKVALDRDTGAWKDWRTGEKGDVLGLVAYVMQTDVRGALAWSRDWLGISRMSGEDRRRMAERARQAQQTAVRDREAGRLKRMGQAERIWNKGFQDGARSTAEALGRAYFAARQVPLDAIPNRDLQTFRFAPAQEFWSRAQFRHQDGRRVKVQDGPLYPAVLSAMRLATGQVAAVHMTFLSPLGPQKLPVSKDENAKIMFGEAMGAMIRISHGPEGEPPETARQVHPLIIGEGIETVASLAISAPEARVWAGGSLAGMLHAPVDLPCIGAILVAKDHFKSPTTEKQFNQVLEAYGRCGKPIVVMETPVGNDFNDLMQDDEGEDE